MLNLMLVGHLGNDPVSRMTQNGKNVTSFNVAVNNNRNGQEYTTWFHITAWGKLAENCAQYLQKGRQVAVTANRIEAQAWQAEDGSAQANLHITASNVKFL